MELSNLTIQRPDAPQPYWATAYFVYNAGSVVSGPIVAVLWWEDGGAPAFVVEENGVVDEEEFIDLPSWNYWLLGDSSPAMDDPRRDAANVTGLGECSPGEAIRNVVADLEGADAPTVTHTESLELIEEMLWCPRA